MINKLVRDYIPDIIRSNGKIPIYKVVKNEDTYIKLLQSKLQEEVTEYLETGQIIELCDIVEVIYSLLKAEGISQSKFEDMRCEKAATNGTFEKRIFLKEIKNK